jgi:hypothetical protein
MTDFPYPLQSCGELRYKINYIYIILKPQLLYYRYFSKEYDINDITLI